MARKPQEDRLEQIYHQIEKRTGSHPGIIARILGLHRSQVIRSLPVMEEQGLLLSEDDNGKLYPFSRRK